jgi:cysteine synthase
MWSGIKTEIWVKLEYHNPTGSIKDRIALYMIEEAERRGLIHSDDTIVKPKIGNTGTSLAFVCTLKGYRMIAVMPDQISKERKDIMHAFGSKIVLVKTKTKPCSGMFTREDIEATMKTASTISNQKLKDYQILHLPIDYSTKL